MILSQATIWLMCASASIQTNIPTHVLMGLCEQESSYDAFAVRLENGYYLRYVKTNPDFKLHTEVDKVLLSTSWGLTQIMGANLHALGLFDNVESIPQALDNYLRNPELQVLLGARWLRKEIDKGGSLVEGLRRYNGSASYPPLVLRRAERIKKERST